MEPELFLVKNKFGCAALDDESAELYKTFEYGSIFHVDHWKDRKIWNHRKLFLLAQIVTHNSYKWTDPYHFIKTMQLDIGSVTVEKKLTGEVVQTPKSLKFKSMGEAEFKKLFSDCANLMLANLNMLLPGMHPDDFNNQVIQILELC